MTEELRYLSCRGEALLIGRLSGLGLLYGPQGAQLEGGNSVLMGRLFFLLVLLTNKLRFAITNVFQGCGVSLTEGVSFMSAATLVLLFLLLA